MADKIIVNTMPGIKAVQLYNSDEYAVAVASRDLITFSALPAADVNVGVESGMILAANGNRKAAIVVNDSDETIYVALGYAAVVGRGIRLNAAGGSLVIAGGIYTNQAINGIHGGSGNKRVTVQEAT